MRRHCSFAESSKRWASIGNQQRNTRQEKLRKTGKPREKNGKNPATKTSLTVFTGIATPAHFRPVASTFASIARKLLFRTRYALPLLARRMPPRGSMAICFADIGYIVALHRLYSRFVVF